MHETQPTKHPPLKANKDTTLVETNHSHLTTVQNVPKQSFVLHPEGTNIKQSWQQMQVLKRQQNQNELCEFYRNL